VSNEDENVDLAQRRQRSQRGREKKGEEKKKPQADSTAR
jgi:hypothetical protein